MFDGHRLEFSVVCQLYRSGFLLWRFDLPLLLCYLWTAIFSLLKLLPVLELCWFWDIFSVWWCCIAARKHIFFPLVFPGLRLDVSSGCIFLVTCGHSTSDSTTTSAMDVSALGSHRLDTTRPCSYRRRRSRSIVDSVLSLIRSHNDCHNVIMISLWQVVIMISLWQVLFLLIPKFTSNQAM